MKHWLLRVLIGSPIFGRITTAEGKASYHRRNYDRTRGDERMNPQVIQWRVRASTEALQRASDDNVLGPTRRETETDQGATVTWLSTWCVYGTPRYAEHASEAAAEQDAKTKRAAGFEAVHFWAGSEA